MKLPFRLKSFRHGVHPEDNQALGSFESRVLPSANRLKDLTAPEHGEALVEAGFEAFEADGLVLEEWQKGYQHYGRLLRPARVKVGRHVKKAGE